MTFSVISFILFFQSLLSGGDSVEKEPKLIWSDEFSTDGAPDSTNWTYDIGNGHDGWGNQEAQYYTNTRENSYVKDGKLFIEAKKKNGQWTSARLKSQGKKSWTYGRIVFSAKLPAGKKGSWPALW